MTFFVSTKRLGLGLAAVAGLALAGLANTSDATLLWYDGFAIGDDGAGPDYVVGGLDGQVGGNAVNNDSFGSPFFAGAWDMAGTDNNLVGSTSLSIPGQLHPSVGGSVSDEPTNGRTTRLFSNQWGAFTDPDDTFYFGFLANFGTLGNPAEPDNAQHRVIEMHNGPHEPNDDFRILQFGYSSFAFPPFNGNTGETGGNMKLQANGITVEVDTDLATPGIQPLAIANDGKTHFIVLKFDMSTTALSDTVSVYLDPAGTTEPAEANAVISGLDFFADRMTAITNFQFNGGNMPVFDELRVATNGDGLGFADVANWSGVPEPGTLSLVVLTAMGLLLAGRKRS